MQLMRRFGVDLRSLPAQIILTLVALVLLTAAAVGLPAIWLIQGQLDRQAWAQVEQGSQAAQALYAAQHGEITSLATLTAQRPTLRDLLAQEDRASMEAYLRTLKTGAGLDLVLVCGPNQQAMAWAGELISDTLCATPMPAGFQVISTGTAQEVWRLAAHPIGDKDADTQGTVIVGIALDDEFATQMQAQTGLEHTLVVDSQPVASSLEARAMSRRPASLHAPEDAARDVFTVDDHPHYAIRFPLNGPGNHNGQTEAEVALAVADIVATRRSLVWTLAGSVVIVAAVGSVFGTFLARRISQPLARLSEAATTLSQGNLDSSMAIEAQVREVALVAQALETARIGLRRSLTELQQEKAWADHLLEAIVEGIVTLDHQDRIIFFSPGAERITGWSRDEVLTRSCDEVFRLVETGEPFSQFIPPPGQRHKITVELANGHQATLAITGAQLLRPESGDAQVALVFRDISEEEAVHRLMGHFMANVTHEFRTPLSALAASVELLLDQAPDLSAAELHELLTPLHLGILGLQTLVDNLLESASIEAGRFRVSPRPSKLGNIIAEGIRMMQPLLDKRGQRLVVELPAVIPVVRADSRRTMQVLVNLLSNASKYGPDDAEIIVGAAVSEGWVRVTVADRGPGIPPKYRNDVFRRFVYPDVSGDRVQYGAGLGLSVVKAVIEAHGGRVGVEDRPGGGSVFWFTLPVESEG
jgi:PAS domain S-box-containing protein